MILAILQARVSSSRLPGKVLKPILGRPMLELQIERITRSRLIDRLLVATSTDPGDDGIATLCDRLGVPCFRGSLDDVLDRFYSACISYHPEHVVRLTGDCPVSDPALIDDLIQVYLEGNYDYGCNALEPTWPDGLDAEVFRFSAIERAWKESTLPSERAHVTPFIYNHPEQFRILSQKGKVDLSHLRWTVDEPADFEVIRTIFEELYPRNPHFATQEILELIKHRPELTRLNASIPRDEGYAKSLEEDKITMATKNMSQCQAIQTRARARIPGMTQLLSKRPDQFSLGVWPGYYRRAKGATVWDLDGNEYTDMSISGIGANVLGYADEDVDAAVMEAIRNGTSCSLNCVEEVELAELLCELHPWAEKVRFARTGGESMAIAVRIARAASGRDKVAFCGYHGWHDWYLAANLGTENALGDHLLPGLDPAGVPKGLTGTAIPFHYNQLSELEAIVAAHPGEIGVITMEPIRNDDPTPEFIEGVRRIATEIGAVLVVDEISAGFRLNTGGAHTLVGLKPDIAVFSKALGNGYPIGAIIGRASIMDAAQSTFISSTYWTERIGPTAALATIAKFRRLNAAEHLVSVGRAIQEGWKQAAARSNLKLHVGGIPPLSHFVFDEGDHFAQKALFVQLMLDRGFLASNTFYSMLAHTREHVSRYLAAAEECFGLIATAAHEGRVDALLTGKPSAAGFKRLI